MTNAKSAVDAGAAPARKPRRVSRTAAFSEIVRDHMDLAPAIMPEHTACAEVIRAMREQGGSSVLIADADGRLKGIVTERDVVRHIAYQASGSTRVEQIMSAPVLTIRDDDYLFHAIATMRRRDLRHMPDVDKQGRVVKKLIQPCGIGIA